MRASGVISPMRSANAPTNAAPEAASPAENSAPACCEPTWLCSRSSSGRRTTPAAVADLGHLEADVPVEGDRLLEPLRDGFVVHAQRTSIGFAGVRR